MEALLQIETVSSAQNVKALRRLYDNISSHIQSLESLEVKEETYGNLLCPILITKIPAELQLIVSRKVPEAEWKLKQLMTVVEEEIIARERLGQSKNPRRNDGKPPPTATALLSADSNSTTRTCCYCDQQHYSTDCSKVTQVDARKQLLRKAGRCFSCLRKGYPSKYCRSSRRCQTCNGKHHTSICTGSAIVEGDLVLGIIRHQHLQPSRLPRTSTPVHLNSHSPRLIRRPQHFMSTLASQFFCRLRQQWFAIPATLLLV